MRKLLLTGVLVCALAACKSSPSNPSTSGGGTLAPEMKRAAVTMDGTGTPLVSPDPLPLKKNQDRAVWEGASEIRIDLPAGYEPPVCGQYGAVWRCTSKTFGNVERIKYSVSMRDTAGAWKTRDPMLDIQP
jgi:hypothetical protein